MMSIAMTEGNFSASQKVLTNRIHQIGYWLICFWSPCEKQQIDRHIKNISTIISFGAKSVYMGQGNM